MRIVALLGATTPRRLLDRLGVDAPTVTSPDGNARDAWALTDPHWVTGFDTQPR